MDVIPADFYRSDIILSDGRGWLLRVSATEGGDQQQRQQECGRPHRSASRAKRLLRPTCAQIYKDER